MTLLPSSEPEFEPWSAVLAVEAGAAELVVLLVLTLGRMAEAETWARDSVQVARDLRCITLAPTDPPIWPACSWVSVAGAAMRVLLPLDFVEKEEEDDNGQNPTGLGFRKLKDEDEGPRVARRYGRVRWAPGAATDAR